MDVDDGIHSLSSSSLKGHERPVEPLGPCFDDKFHHVVGLLDPTDYDSAFQPATWIRNISRSNSY